VSEEFCLGLFYTILRPEEREILQAAERRGVRIDRLHDAAQTFALDPPGDRPSVVLNRSVSHSRALYASRFFEHYGIPTINSPDTLEVSGDKVLTSLRLRAHGIPTPRTVVALTPDAALRALDGMGYPAVLKPPVGSWGRLMAKVDSRREAIQILEHKGALSSPQHSIFYIQEYVEKPGRDIRAFVVGDQLTAAMYRYSGEWRTNSALGGTTEPLEPSPELCELSLRAAEAVGGGILAVDLMESSGGLVVHEVNPTPEFKALTATTHVDVAGAIVNYAMESMRR
jgi:[lysine-biosynthesis-protein LysW]---L-2-aminoadipate ligase